MSKERVEEIMREAVTVLHSARILSDPTPSMHLPEADIQMIRDLPDDAEHMDHVIIGADGKIRILGVELIPA